MAQAQVCVCFSSLRRSRTSMEGQSRFTDHLSDRLEIFMQEMRSFSANVEKRLDDFFLKFDALSLSENPFCNSAQLQAGLGDMRDHSGARFTALQGMEQSKVQEAASALGVDAFARCALGDVTLRIESLLKQIQDVVQLAHTGDPIGHKLSLEKRMDYEKLELAVEEDTRKDEVSGRTPIFLIVTHGTEEVTVEVKLADSIREVKQKAHEQLTTWLRFTLCLDEEGSSSAFPPLAQCRLYAA